MKEFRVSRDGKTHSLILLVGVFLIEVFAIWSFINLAKDGLSWVEVIPAIILFVMACAAPFLAWSILEEVYTKITVDDRSIRFNSVGVEILSSWTETGQIENKEDDADDEGKTVKLRLKKEAIQSPVLRFLHGQANGSRVIPIYASIENQAELVSFIKEKIGKT